MNLLIRHWKFPLRLALLARKQSKLPLLEPSQSTSVRPSINVSTRVTINNLVRFMACGIIVPCFFWNIKGDTVTVNDLRYRPILPNFYGQGSTKSIYPNYGSNKTVLHATKVTQHSKLWKGKLATEYSRGERSPADYPDHATWHSIIIVFEVTSCLC